MSSVEQDNMDRLDEEYTSVHSVLIIYACGKCFYLQYLLLSGIYLVCYHVLSVTSGSPARLRGQVAAIVFLVTELGVVCWRIFKWAMLHCHWPCHALGQEWCIKTWSVDYWFILSFLLLLKWSKRINVWNCVCVISIDLCYQYISSTLIRMSSNMYQIVWRSYFWDSFLLQVLFW